MVLEYTQIRQRDDLPNLDFVKAGLFFPNFVSGFGFNTFVEIALNHSKANGFFTDILP